MKLETIGRLSFGLSKNDGEWQPQDRIVKEDPPLLDPFSHCSIGLFLLHTIVYSE